MLSQGDILERIGSGRTKLIKKVIMVQYEPRIHLPIDFWFLEQHHEILEVISSKKLGRFSSEFLVRTDKGIYSLKFFYFEINIPNLQLTFNGWWKLDFKVLE
ncbi:MAG: hypothetical protein H7263_17390 [Candidatus Sericytochromatia bacterium]|nr:hypothetical protein [Candidatus Sericytochromatia bacterium]